MVGTQMGGWGRHHSQDVSTPPAMDPPATSPPGVPEAEGVSEGQEEKLDLSIRVMSVQCCWPQPAQPQQSHLG